MKKIILLFVFFIAAQSFAQTNGISYQAIIMNPKGEQLPGVNNANSPVVNKNICLVFKFVDEFSNIEYQETVQTKTDGFGMVNLVIGKGTQTAGYAASFQSIVWNSSKKSLIVGINTNGNCSTYTEISNQEFSYAPLAFLAINAQNVTGVVAIENGGTNATTVLGAKTNLQLENVDNTTDLNKPISTATQTALNLKENLANKSTNVTTDGTSDIKYPSVKSVKTYVDASATLSSTALANEISRATTAENTIVANLVTEINNRTAADNTLTTNLSTETAARTSADATFATNLNTETSTRVTADNTLTTNLSTETAARTSADGTLTTNLATEVSNRTAADLLKEDLANKSTSVTTDGTSDTKYPSVKSVKTYVDASAASSSSALTNEVSRATAAENTIATNLTAETAARTSADNTLTTNLNTETAARTSADATLTSNLLNEVTRATVVENTIATNLTAEIAARTSADATLQTNINAVQADVDANETAANTALNLKAPLASPTFTGTVSGITKTMIGLANVDNISDANKPVSTATQTALDLKVDKVSGERLINASEITKLSNQSGINTGDQDLSSYATNTALALKAPLASPTFTGTVSGITKTMVGLANVDNISDANKPVSTATQTALDLKVDKVSGERLINASEITKLSNQSGINTGDQDISGIAVNATKIGDLTGLTTTAKSNLVAAINEIEAGKANLDSPTLIGTPLAPTAPTGTNTTQIATTAFVTDAITTSSTPDASTTVKGKIQLAGDLTGIAALPTISNDAVTSTKIADGTILNSDISSSAGITYSKLTLTNSIQNIDLVANSVTTSKVANGTVTTSKMADQAISSLKILDGTILNEDIDPTAAIAYSKLNLVGSVTSADITDGAITSAKIATSPTFTGIPLAPTATAGTNTTQIATTAFVTTAITGNYVDLTTNQIIAGIKTFSSDVTINATKFGRGAGSDSSSRNIAIGNSSLASNSNGIWNTAIGTYALQKNTNSSYNTAVGNEAISEAIPGANNTGIGSRALMYTSGAGNTSVGTNALINSAAGNNNTAIGLNAFSTNTTGSNNTAIGASTVVSSAGLTNATAIGYEATVTASNTIQLGNTSVTDVKTSGSITAGGYKTPSGTSSQFLMADGSVSTGGSGTSITEYADEFTATAAQTSFTLSQTPSTNSKVKMYINGIRISNTAYSASATTLTYTPTNNGSYTLSAGDRIQFDYFH